MIFAVRHQRNAITVEKDTLNGLIYQEDLYFFTMGIIFGRIVMIPEEKMSMLLQSM